MKAGAKSSAQIRWSGEWIPQWLTVGPPEQQVPVLLRRRVRRAKGSAKRSVVLIPGANSSCDTFIIPHGGLAKHLADLDVDVWLFDWRASPYTIQRLQDQPPLGGTAQAERGAFTLDRAVAEDIPAALEVVRAQIGDGPLSVMGHCVGGGGLAMAIARGLLSRFRVDRVVLSTLGLFYEVPWNTWIKAEDFLLERIFLPDDQPSSRFIDPKDRSGWPRSFEEAFARWPRTWLPGGASTSDEFLRQLSFMVGRPYAPEKLDPSIVDTVEDVFGAIHVGLYTHLGQMVRRGYSAHFDVRDTIDRARLYRGLRARRAPRGDFRRQPFLSHEVTLVAAGDNAVWHRDAIDLMYEWLLRSPKMRCEKQVLPGYNIQELFWARDAPTEVYDVFARGLGCLGPWPLRTVSSLPPALMAAE